MCNLTLKIDAIGLIHVLDMTVYFPRVLPYPMVHVYASSTDTSYNVKKHDGMPLPSSHWYICSYDNVV